MTQINKSFPVNGLIGFSLMISADGKIIITTIITIIGILSDKMTHFINPLIIFNDHQSHVWING